MPGEVDLNSSGLPRADGNEMASLIQLKDGSAGVRLPIDKPRFSIGRGADNDISIDDELVSKYHAVIEQVESPDGDGNIAYYIQDLESTNSTFVNEETVSLFRLAHGDVIQVGRNFFRFADETEETPDDTTKLHKTWIPGVYYTSKKTKAKAKARGKKDAGRSGKKSKK